MQTIPETHRDLLESNFATLATLGPDGLPQLSEVWFLADGDEIGISLSTGRQKTKNLQSNPVCTLFVLDLVNPFRYLEIRADANIAADDAYTYADAVGAKYGADLRQYDGPGESRVVVRLRPRRINAVDMGA